MANVELVISGYERYVPYTDTQVEYTNKMWEEQKVWNKIDQLIGNRKVIQRKIDAARKKLKRIVARLNTIEGSWNPA